MHSHRAISRYKRPMRIRLVDNADFDDIAAILRPYVERTAIHFAATAPTANELRAEWEQARGRYATVVAEIGGAVVGFAKASTFRTRAAYQWSAEIGVYVDERHHRRG